MMRLANIAMSTKVERIKLLATLKANLDKHAAVVQEAREGYVRQAKKELERRLEQIRKGQVVSLHFSLNPPQDYSEVYKNCISMLEWNTAPFVDLKADEFRQLVRDEWDWSEGFYHSNSTYSGQAQKWIEDTTGGAMVAPPE